MRKPSLVFFGSGPVAEASLKSLLEHFTIEAVITKPTTVENMVGLGVLRHNVHAVSDRAGLDELIERQKFQSQLGVIVDFGVIVSKKVINAFPRGILNSHFSLLPRWRGADPISFAILEGDTKTGVSLMLIEPSLDTGNILVQKSLPIAPDDTTPTLTQKLIELSNQLLAIYIPRYLNNEIKPRQQPHPDRATYSRKLTKDDGWLDAHKPAARLEREIRAYAGWPGSRLTANNRELIVTQAHVADQANPKELTLGTANGYLVIDRLKPAGKKEMTAAEFIRGYLKN